jgi:hypothetical protein
MLEHELDKLLEEMDKLNAEFDKLMELGAPTAPLVPPVSAPKFIHPSVWDSILNDERKKENQDIRNQQVKDSYKLNKSSKTVNKKLYTKTNNVIYPLVWMRKLTS